MKRVIVISDCDGCLTDGRFIYTADGKVAKIYGPHDADGVKLLKKHDIQVEFISADKRGYAITEKRITDMKCKLTQVSEPERVEYIKNRIDEYAKEFPNDEIVSVFFGDGIGDAPVSEVVTEFIAPANARKEAKAVSSLVTESIGGQGAFLDLAIYIVEKYR